MTPEQLIPWIAVIVVFVGMVALNLRTISALMQIAMTAMGGKQAAPAPVLPAPVKPLAVPGAAPD